MMKPFISLLYSLLILLVVGSVSHPDIIHQTCKHCSLSSHNVNYTLCVDSLDSIPKSHIASLKGLGVTSTQIAVANATNIVSKVRKLLKNYQPKGSSYMRSCLEDCLDLYSDTVSSLKDSVKAIKDGSYDDANIWISSAVDMPSTCEGGFKEGNIESPLTKENDELFAHVIIALCISAMLEAGIGR